MKSTFRIATRQSPLALWQANYVKQQLEVFHPSKRFELVPFMTKADKQPFLPLAQLGGKGVFIKELEAALLERRADIAVHSVKDMTIDLSPGLVLYAICKREDPRDAFLSLHHPCLLDLPEGSVIGSSSLRRQCQLKALRPDLQIKALRGNVETRLNALQSGEFGGVILAVAGLKRLNKSREIRQYLELDEWLPAVGQAAIGIECRADDLSVMGLLQPLNHPETYACVLAERAMNKALGGSCCAPIAGYAVMNEKQFCLQGLVGSLDGRQMIQTVASGNNPEQLGYAVARNLLAQGANKLL